MKRKQPGDRTTRVRGHRSDSSPLSEKAWSEFRRSLSDALGALEEDEYLILVAKAEDYFVQFAGQEDQGMRAEAISNTFIKKSTPLSDEACQELIMGDVASQRSLC